MRKELSLGTDVGNGCQLMSSSLGGRFRGRRGGEALLDEQAGGSKIKLANRLLGTTVRRNDLKLVICMISQHYHFFHGGRRDSCQHAAFDQIRYPLHR